MKYEIRKMLPDDWEQVKTIYTQGIEEGTSTFGLECPEHEAWSATHLEICRYVICSGGVVVGWCAVAPTSSKPAYWGNVEESIYIDREHRGNGAGSALLRHLCSESEHQGIWCLYAVIMAANAASIGLHEKCGFRTIGKRERAAQDRFGQWQDCVLMERRSKLI